MPAWGWPTDRRTDTQTGEVGIETVDQQAREVGGGRPAGRGEARLWVDRLGGGREKRNATRQCNAVWWLFLVRFSVPGLELAGWFGWLAIVVKAGELR